MLLDHQTRVVEERDELQERINKLTDFMYTKIFAELTAVNQGLLMSQLRIMKPYLSILNERIDLF